MTETTIVQYRTKTEFADENQRLIEAVMAALAADKPAGLQYAAYRAADGVTFVHVVHGDGSVLADVPAFQEFQRGSGERVETAPERFNLTLVGSYGS